MLKRESIVPCRRCQLARTVATWSLGGLVVGAALIDATVLAEDPVADTANVELSDGQAAAEIARLQRERDRVLGEMERLARNEVMQALRSSRVREFREPQSIDEWWHAPGAPAPDTALTLTMTRVEVTHGDGATEMAMELRSPCEGASARLGRSRNTRALPAGVTLRDGVHFVAVYCPDDTTLVTELVVGPR